MRSRFVLVGTPNARRAVVLDCTAIRLERRVTCGRRWWRGHLNWRSAESMFHRRIAVSCFELLLVVSDARLAQGRCMTIIATVVLQLDAALLLWWNLWEQATDLEYDSENHS